MGGATPDRPTVYATLGTVFNFARPVFDAILAALRDEPVNLIVTIGRNVGLDAFGPQPGNVHIARYVPQGDADHFSSGPLLAKVGVAEARPT